MPHPRAKVRTQMPHIWDILDKQMPRGGPGGGWALDKQMPRGGPGGMDTLGFDSCIMKQILS